MAPDRPGPPLYLHEVVAAVGVSRRTLYRWRCAPDFAAAHDGAWAAWRAQRERERDRASMSGQWLRSWRGCAGAWRADKGPRVHWPPVRVRCSVAFSLSATFAHERPARRCSMIAASVSCSPWCHSRRPWMNWKP